MRNISGRGGSTTSTCGAKRSCGRNWITCTGIRWNGNWLVILRIGHGAVFPFMPEGRKDCFGWIACETERCRLASNEEKFKTRTLKTAGCGTLPSIARSVAQRPPAKARGRIWAPSLLLIFCPAEKSRRGKKEFSWPPAVPREEREKTSRQKKTAR
jgi:hypothetical protein